MPLTEKGKEIERAMTREYGEKKGEQVFYASRNAGTISGVDADRTIAQITGADAFGRYVIPGDKR